MFKTELHCHSCDVSACARVDVNTIVNKFVDAGYSTLVLSNHFNSATYEHLKSTDWNDWIDKFLLGYTKLKECASGKLNILLGMELRFNENNNDYLVFGIDEELLRSQEGIFASNPWKFHEVAKEKGLLFIQAHPFRSDMTVVDPRALDGVEVFNGHKGHDSRNDIANMWADKFGLIKTSGTDFHYDYAPANAGIMTENEITSLDELIEVLRSGCYTLIRE